MSRSQNHHLMIEHPHHGTSVVEYTPEEMTEILGARMSERLAKGEVVFREGALWVDMAAAARSKIEEELYG